MAARKTGRQNVFAIINNAAFLKAATKKGLADVDDEGSKFVNG
jgi:hypothetical protein